MTNAKHTPGPWKVHPYLASGPHCKYRDVGPGLRAVCNVIGEFEKDNMGDEQEANARLIAAAPDLLEALREIEWLFDGKEDINNNGGPNDAMKALAIVHEAIAKATGEA